MSSDTEVEARRQIEVCNACRYCEGYCSVFPAIARQRIFSDADVTQLANLCHNCRGCYYACQYTDPHEFSINLPQALARVRQDSWEKYAFPAVVGSLFHRSGVALSAALVLSFALIMILLKSVAADAGGTGFYALMSHAAMVLIFLPAFLFPLLSLFFSLRRYWIDTGGGVFRLRDLLSGLRSAASMKNLSGGHGDGCNFEDEDRFSNSRRWMHQVVVVGFLMCFASTSVATLLHYGFDMPAPYGLFSLPKLLGIPGGILLSVGTLAMAVLKLKADRELADTRVWGGEMGFIMLLFVVSTSGLALYALRDSTYVSLLLSFHLGSVFAFFIVTPYSKMAHGFYRLAALARDANQKAG